MYNVSMFRSPTLSPFQNPFPTEGAAAEDWWLSGGISAGDCVAAYQPKGATSLAASYSNLNNQGTYDASPGVAPTWDDVNGWIFNAGSTQYLNTDIIPDGSQTWSIICRFTNSIQTIGGLINASSNDAGSSPYISIGNRSGNQRYLTGTKILQVSSAVTAGIMALAGRDAYLNGVSVGQVSIGTSATALKQFHFASFGNAFFLSCYIQAAAIYNTTITANQALSVTNAMNLL